MIWPALYAFIAYCTGWTIPHIRDELDLPAVESLHAQWRQYPPLPMMVAHYLGVARPARPKAPASLDEQDAMPAQRMSAREFDDLVASMRLPPMPDLGATQATP